MTEKEKEAIEIMTKVRDKNVHTFVDELTMVLNLIQKQQVELEKKDKIINEVERQLIDENIRARRNKDEIFQKDNLENESFNFIYSDRYMKYFGYEQGLNKAVEILEKEIEKE